MRVGEATEIASLDGAMATLGYLGMVQAEICHGISMGFHSDHGRSRNHSP